MPTARPIIEIRFGVKKLKCQTWPSRPTMPSVTAIANMPITIGATPATIAPNTTIRTRIAAATPIVSPNRRSSSEIFLKSSDELTWPSM